MELRKRDPRERRVWERIAETLNQNEILVFKVDLRSVRDHYALLEKKHKKKTKEKEGESGTSPTEDEVDQAMENIAPQFAEADAKHRKEMDELKAKADEETSKAQEMRRQSLETFSETLKRNKNEQPSPSKKKTRATGLDTTQYLQQKISYELEIRKEVLDQRKIEKKTGNGFTLSRTGSQEKRPRSKRAPRPVVTKPTAKDADIDFVYITTAATAATAATAKCSTDVIIRKLNK